MKALLFIPIIALLLAAQTQTAFKVGDRVEADPLLIGAWRIATVVKVYVVDGAVNGYEIRYDARNGRTPEQYTVGKTEARGIRPAKAHSQSGRVAPAPNARSTCSSDTALLPAARNTDSMELSFKRAILKNYQKRLAETGLSTPLAVGVAFSGFESGAPRVNQRTLDRIDGTYLRSAPLGAQIYPVKTNFTECEQFRSEVIRTTVDGRYECYKDNFGQWSCSNASGWRIVDTKREEFGAR